MVIFLIQIMISKLANQNFHSTKKTLITWSFFSNYSVLTHWVILSLTQSQCNRFSLIFFFPQYNYKYFHRYLFFPFDQYSRIVDVQNGWLWIVSLGLFLFDFIFSILLSIALLLWAVCPCCLCIRLIYRASPSVVIEICGVYLLYVQQKRQHQKIRQDTKYHPWCTYTWWISAGRI